MKKLFILAVLSVALNALAEDQFLYWMIGPGATGADGEELVDSGNYYAKVRTSPWAGEYLNLYVSPDAEKYGQEYHFQYISGYGSGETFAGFRNGQGSSPFFVELYLESGEWVGGSYLSYGGENLTTGGMAYVDPAAVNSVFNVVPEPTSGLLLLLGVAGLALKRKRA